MTRSAGSALDLDQRLHYSETTLSVLGYREDGEWVALALEMDLRGYGDTWEEALKELRDLVLAQIGFAFAKKQPQMIWRNAEDVYWTRFREVQQSSFFPRDVADLDDSEPFHAGSLAIPAAQMRVLEEERFMLADG